MSKKRFYTDCNCLKRKMGNRDIKKTIAQYILDGKNVALYCYGIQAEYIVSYLWRFYNIAPLCIIDNDIRKRGISEEGIPILPYCEAKEKYGKIFYFICSDDYKYTIIGDLLEKGEKPDSIINYVPVEKRKGCLYFSNRLLFVQGSSASGIHSLVHCNADSFKKHVYRTDFEPKSNYADSEEILNEEFRRFRTGEIEKCGNCVLNREQYLVKDGYEKHYKAVAFYQKNCSDCIASCTYCCVGGNTEGKFNDRYDSFDDYQVFVTSILHSGRVDDDFTLSFDTSERDMNKKIAVGRECIAENGLNPLVVKVNSCLVVYSDQIADMIRKGQCYIIWSLDAGTRETYRKIKQIDAFDKAVENVKRYIAEDIFEGRFIIPKYLIVKGVNDNEREFDAFLALISSLGLKNASLSYDFYAEMSEEDAHFIQECYEKLVKNGIKLTYKNNSKQVTEALNMNNIMTQ